MNAFECSRRCISLFGISGYYSHTTYAFFTHTITHIINHPMKVVVQRVSQASVEVDDENIGKIGTGLLLLVAVHQDDDNAIMKWIADKIVKLRIFEDEGGKMNRSVLDEGAQLLVVSQFTLYGDVKKGTRPGFGRSAKPEKAERLYDEMVKYWRERYTIQVETGLFGSMMNVSLVNHGPVTLIVEKNRESSGSQTSP